MTMARLLVALLATSIFARMPNPLKAQPPEVLQELEAAKARAAAASESNSEEKKNEPKDGEKPDGDKPEKEGEKKEDKKDDAKPKVITRPEAEEGAAADMARLQQQVGRDGMVRFNLEGVPWPDLLRWLADASSLSLDWQELPADTLNLRTQHPYSVEEARDVINRHLLSRGFTMLKHGELLSVVNIEKLNPGLVPRVRPDDLDERMPHEFVKVSIPLDWLIAEKAVEELKPMLSPNGKLTALSSTNRLEAIDAVVNLRELYTFILEEQTQTTDNRVVEVFHLLHVPATDAVGLIEQILGLETNRSMSGSIDDNTGRMIMQQLQQMQRNMQNSNSKGGGGEDEDKPKLIVNDRDNSIVAHAPPDKMEIIRQTVTALDTPTGQRGRSLHTKVFRLSTLDPVALTSIIQELADLSPATRLQADETNNSLIVHGTLVDLNSVHELITELDSSTRNFEVIPLRRLAADEVAGTIQYLMGSEEDDDNNQNSGYYSYYSYRYSRGGNSRSQEEKRPFKVDADIENNRLLLWANEVELEEVQNLLVKMGEIPSGEGSNETFRVIDLSTDEDAERALERIRQMWPHLAPNQLQIQPLPRPTEEESTPSGALPETHDDPNAAEDIRTTTTDVNSTHPLLVALTEQSSVSVSELAEEAEEIDVTVPVAPPIRHPVPGDRVSENVPQLTAAPSGNASAAPPIVIQRGPDGKLIITSPDTRALDQLEAMMADVAPPRKDYHIFHLKYPQTWAYGIELTLEDFFKEEVEGSPTLDWWGGVVNQRDSSPSRLSKRKPLRFIGDDDSRTVLVQGATPSQLATIADLIEIYDQPASSDPQAMRTTKFFHLEYSSAQAVADTLKSVYRDLLSTNDPALRDPNGDKENRPQNTGTTLTYVYNRGNTGEDESGEEPSRITFEGLLSVGVDDISNTLVVSAIEGLMPEISEIVQTLDKAAMPAGNFRVVPLDPSINSALVQTRLQKLLESKRQQQPPGQNNNQNGQNGGEGNGNNGNRGGGGPFGGPR